MQKKTSMSGNGAGCFRITRIGSGVPLTFFYGVVKFRREVMFVRGNLVSVPRKKPSKDLGLGPEKMLSIFVG